MLWAGHPGARKARYEQKSLGAVWMRNQDLLNHELSLLQLAFFCCGIDLVQVGSDCAMAKPKPSSDATKSHWSARLMND
ncbi:MAG: hypothetical protein IPN53_23480 [Comamonadaceae bacterium]|nr:hypothetical protein [Comamonadaceae bacterium]